jgi:hypothetical protein
MGGQKNMSWNRYEAALLLDTLRKVQSGFANRKDAASKLSLRLREGTAKSGIAISDTYRNTNGIELQFGAMEYCLSNGQKGISSPSRVFYEIADMFQSDPDSYMSILDIANRIYPEIKHQERKPETENIKVETRNNTSPNTSETEITETPKFQSAKQSAIEQPQFNLGQTIAEQRLAIDNQIDKLMSGSHTKQTQNNYTKAKESLFDDEPTVAEPTRQFVSAKIKNVLLKSFHQGFRLSSAIDSKKFRRTYSLLNGEDYLLSDEMIAQEVLSCGIEHDGIVYLPEIMAPESLKKELIGYIENAFKEHNKYVYYSVLFAEFNDQLLDTKIFSESMLKEYLQYFKGDKWFFRRSYVSKHANIVHDVESEVINLVKSVGTAITEDEICEKLPMIPADKIRTVIIHNSDTLLSIGRKGLRFHIDNFQISGIEKQKISECIATAILQYDYLTASELISDIKNIAPDVIDYNECFGESGIRNALSVIFANKFSFSGNIISAKNKSMNAYDVTKSFCLSHETFSLSDIQTLCGEIDTNVNFDYIAEFSIRVSHDLFVRDNKINFDIEATDNILKKLCPNKYISLNEITLFSSMPDCGYSWNEYLLESYAAKISHTFKLIHQRYNQDATNGAIVRKSAAIDSFYSLLADVVGRSDVNLQKDTVLDFLQSEGFIARRRMNDIENIIMQARLIRNQLKTKE